MIEIKITGDTANAIMNDLFVLAAAWAKEPEKATEALEKAQEVKVPAETAKAPQNETSAKSEPVSPMVKQSASPDGSNVKQCIRKEDFGKREPSPFMKFVDTVVQCISEEQHTELKALSSKFLTADPGKHRPMLRKWFDDHNVKRLSELPAAKADEFKKWLEANMDAG